MTIDGPSALLFIFVLARVIGCFILMPFFSERSVSQVLKIIFAIWIAIVMMYMIPKNVLIPEHPIELILAFVNEFLLGLFIGFIARLFFYGIQLSGSIMDMQMGLSVAASFDPATGAQATIMSRLMYITSVAVFLIIDGHHMLLAAIHQSYTTIPLFSEIAYPMGVSHVGYLGSQMFLIATKYCLARYYYYFYVRFLTRVAGKVSATSKCFS